MNSRSARFAVGVAFTGAALAGCGGAAADSPESSAESSTGYSTEEAECVEVAHELGVACVPQSPQRVVTLDPLTALPTLLALDVPVVGSAAVYPGPDLPFPAYLDPGDVANIPTVGGMRAVEIEKVAELRPDLIIADGNSTDLYEQLSAIAPTVVTGYAFYTTDWRDEVELVGEAVGKSGEVQALLGDLGTRIATTREALAGRGAEPTLTTVTFYGDTIYFYRYGCTWIGDVVTSAGVGAPEAQRQDCSDRDPASALGVVGSEDLRPLDADAIVTFVQGASGSDEGFAAVAAHPLWRQLGAVRDWRTFGLDDAWGYGASVAAAHHVLDDLEKVVFAGN